MSPPFASIMEPGTDTLCRMDDLAEALARVKAADLAFAEQQTAANNLKTKLFDECADAIRAGATADVIEAKLKEGKTPKQIEDGLTFTAAYIRRKARDRGVAPQRGGPKPRKAAVQE